MGEIKSTLEIIMEKAEGITVTDEEREGFQRIEIEGKMRRLLQRFFEHRMTLSDLKEEVDRLDRQHAGEYRKALQKIGVEQIDPEGKNQPLLIALAEVTGLDTDAVRRHIDRFQKSVGKRRDEIRRRMLEDLKRQGISGSAVVPNLNTDPDWLRFLSESRASFVKSLREFL
jgi:hypothetical protein